MNSLQLRPWHYASVSGGKDSLYMLLLILKNPDKYPLDGVVHFELEVDHLFVKDVTSLMESMCSQVGVKFIRIRPRIKFYDLVGRYGPPTRFNRWCNQNYKLDCKRQLSIYLKSFGCRPIAYIGYCADETRRIKPSKKQFEIYPLVENGISESSILELAKDNPIFGDFYKHNKRQGCYICPMQSMRELAYLRKFKPALFEEVLELAEVSESVYDRPYFGRPLDNVLKNLEREKYR